MYMKHDVAVIWTLRIHIHTFVNAEIKIMNKNVVKCAEYH